MEQEVFEIFKEDGTLKTKEEFVEEMEQFYDKVQESQEGLALEETEEVYSSDEILEGFHFSERKLYLNEEITDDIALYFLERIQYWNAMDSTSKIPKDKRLPIQIYINSPGGLLTAAFQIVDTIRGSTTPVQTIVTGTAYSGAFLVAIAGHKRAAFPHSTFLFHEGSNSFYGDAHKTIQQSDFYKNLLKKMQNIIHGLTNIDMELYEQKKKDDWYFDADEANRLKVIDCITLDINGGFYDEEGA